VQDAYFEANTNSTAYPIADLTRHANQALDEMVSIAISSNGTWQFDDSNNTDLPIGTTALVSGQADYTFDNEYLMIEQIRVKDSNGNWSDLTPVDRNNEEMKAEILSLETTSGLPIYYDKFGESIYLYPKPNYSQSASLKAFFQRKASYFSTTDTTKEPGFPKHLHKYVPLYCAFSFASAKGLAKKNDLYQRLQVEAQRIKDHFGRREKDIKRRLQTTQQNNK
jgi:hypothetical protein